MIESKEEAPQDSNRRFGIHVVLTTTKTVSVQPREEIQKVKETALDKFGIPKSNASQYHLATSPGNPAARLDDSKTVEECAISEGTTLYLIKPHDDA